MIRDIRALASEPFDVLVIGGGIFGAGVARDAALRGLRVALVEQADFASGTSSRSTKLVHGGFRYLEQWAFRLVAESCRERDTLRRIAPHLVRPLPFLLPVYAADRRPLWQMRLGMTLYDWLALYRNPAAHETLSAAEVLADEPLLERRGLRGGVRFYDCQMDDARLCLENVIDAAAHGAVVANYCAVTGLATESDRVVAARVEDRAGPATADAVLQIRARLFVNAAGPWVDRVVGLAPFDSRAVAMSPTKGVHLILPRRGGAHGLLFQSRHDARMLFVIPWGDTALVGTTDTDYDGDRSGPVADEADVAYLLRAARELLPGAAWEVPDVITTFAGIRPLRRGDTAAPSARSRDYRVVRHGHNLLSLVGGKYTTYRSIAERAVDEVFRMGGRRPPRCRTAETPLPDRRPSPEGEPLAECPRVHAGDIAHACRHEMALTVSDVMRRRTGLALSRYGGPETARRVAQLMAPCRGWTESETRAACDAYVAEWNRALFACQRTRT